MKNRFFLILACLIFSANSLFSQQGFQGISGINFENYPRVDGSTSARALNRMIACKLLGIHYTWEMITGNPVFTPMYYEWVVTPDSKDIPNQYKVEFFSERVATSQTHGAFMNLINGEADIILTHRTISPDEKAYADAGSVALNETSIALDALVFIVNPSNSVKSLTVEQVQKIYTGEITHWSEVGGNNANIDVFTRPRNSGSEEVFRTLVMHGIEPFDFPAVSEIGGMAQVFGEVRNSNGICYTFNNYKDMIVRVSDSEVPKIAINNIFPDENTVKSKTYPFISEVHVAIRSDLDRNSMAYKLYEWLQSEDAKSTIIECGFIPSGDYESSIIEQINNKSIQIIPNLTERVIQIRGIYDLSNFTYKIYNSIGQLIQSGNLKQTIDLPSSKGLNILTIMQNQKIVTREKIIVK